MFVQISMNAVSVAMTVMPMQIVQTPLDHTTAFAGKEPLETDVIVHVS